MQEELLTIEDLARVYFRARDASGVYVSMHARDATDEQFHAWAKTRCTLDDEEDSTWTFPERLSFCQFLEQQGRLVLLKRDAP